ncbi:MAG: GNAT family N-acetyltransferase [Alphaproteobacteria bacterium]|nr:GNAT family N-acetyltransferase [Alphaproteobacteria bacterium]
MRKCGDFLKQNESEHNLILSLTGAALKRQEAGADPGIRFITLWNDEGLVIATVQTPPHNLILSRAAQPGLEPLVEVLAGQSYEFPGIVGPSDVAASFAELWTARTGQSFKGYMDQIIYSLTKIIPPPAVEGAMRPAKPEEAPLIAEWIGNFARDALPKTEHLAAPQAEKKAVEMIGEGRVFVWDVGGRPVSQAVASGTAQVARVNMVYTPPEDRTHGYASALVAALSQKQLDEGRAMCCLYADARNTVSNSIYRKIGYEFVGRSSLYVLDTPEE